MILKIKTPKNKFDVEIYSKFILKQEIKTDKKLFNEMCKQGCKNYNKKYSCPPFVPNLIELIKSKQGMYVVLFKCDLNQINSTEYNKMRIANVSMKSRSIKLMRILEQKFNTIFLSTGSCNLCKPCKLKLGKPCGHPDKRRYCLESTGVDCDKLCKDLFNVPMLWYKDKKAPKYTCVVCGLVCNLVEIKEIEKELNRLVPEIFYETKNQS